MYKKVILVTSVFALLAITGCSNEDNEAVNDDTNTKKYLVETTVVNNDGRTGSSYLQLTSDFSGDLDNSSAQQVDFSSTINIFGNEVFTFPSWQGSSNNEVQKLSYTKTTLEKLASLQLPPSSGASNITKVNEEKAYIPLYNLGKVFVVNPETMEKIGEIELKSYAHKDGNPEPSAGIIRGGYYYLSLSQVGANWMPQPTYLQSDVAIIDIKTDKVLKVISEKTLGIPFPTRPFSKNMNFIDENKDIYIACTGFFGYNPQHTKNGFLCIPNGKQEFDVSKSWDISQTNIEGTNYKPAAVYNCKYISNGKLVAHVCVPEFSGDNPYTAKNSMAVLIDLKAKSIKQIKGIPLSDGHGVFIEKVDNIYVIGSSGSEKSGFFTYNPSNGEVKHQLNVVGNPTFFHKFN